MLKVHDYLAIRTAHAGGESKRSIARRLRRSQQTVRQVIASESGRPEAYQRSTPVVYPKLGQFLTLIEAILEQDGTAPIKQRHTSMQIFRRLASDHGYGGKYDPVRRYVNKRRLEERQTLIPLRHEPGRRIECDFGQVAVDLAEGRRTVDVLVAVWSWSNCPFMIGLPNQRTESVLHGMTAAFDFFQCVAREVWWDNPKTIATTILRGRERVLNDDYAALASHYRFEPMACMPATGQEKPDAESAVKALQRRACTPVPQAQDLAEFNRHLLAFCLAERQRTVSGQSQSIGERFEAERPLAIALPAHRFDPCVTSMVVADKYQTVRFQTNRYSVPKWAAFQPATVKAYVDRIEVLQGDKKVAVHARSYGRDESVLEPLHYLAALGRRPGALDHSGVFKEWKLPAIFGELRDRFEREHGVRAGVRHYIRVLQLLNRHPADHVGEAVRRLWHRTHLRAEDVEQKASSSEGLSGLPTRGGPGEPAPVVKNTSSSAPPDALTAPGGGNPILNTIQVPPPDLRRFDQLLSSYHHRPLGGQGEYDGFECNDHPAADAALAAQPQGAEAADHVGGVREALA
jgi:transposase